MRKYTDPFTANAPLRLVEKKAINNFELGKHSSKQNDGMRGNKGRYWCPDMNCWYVATDQHEVCKECNGYHDIIKFDPLIHEL